MGEYIERVGGNHAIRRVLVANNGIAAVKVIRSIRKWAYETFGNEREVRLNSRSIKLGVKGAMLWELGGARVCARARRRGRVHNKHTRQRAQWWDPLHTPGWLELPTPRP